MLCAAALLLAGVAFFTASPMPPDLTTQVERNTERRTEGRIEWPTANVFLVRTALAACFQGREVCRLVSC